VLIDDTSETTNPVLRNLRITQAYHDLGCQLAARGLNRDASWLFFAVWASKTAGGIIRGEELPACLRDLLAENDELHGTREQINERWRRLRRLRLVRCLEHDHLVQVAEQVAEIVEAEIADGNVAVFREIAPLFTALLGQANLDIDKVPPQLMTAMDAYRAALVEPDACRRAVLVLGANASVVAHEQQRLQDRIEAALDAPIAEGLKKVVDTDVVRWLPGRAVRNLTRSLIDRLCTEMERMWRAAVTATVMRLVTADEILDLHVTVPPLPGQPLFGEPLAGTDAGAAVANWDRTYGRGHPCGVDDWASIGERMNYIVNLFRSRQQHPALCQPPFSAVQVSAIETGQIPSGPL
jgi:hypothetical protein